LRNDRRCRENAGRGGAHDQAFHAILLVVMPQVVVIGAGAAGTMAAIFAASAGARTLLVERTRDGGRKILISGGGRCNILPARLDESRFVTDSSRPLMKRMVRSWPLREQAAFFAQQAGLPLVEEAETAKLFPASQSSRDVRDRLLSLARTRGAQIRFNSVVTSVERVDDRWRVVLRGEGIDAPAVVLATGGLSVPATGSDGGGLHIAEALGHSVHPTYPALTPLIAANAPFGNLAGVSLPVSISARAARLVATASGGFLFTHAGYSGPSVLDVSHVAVRSRLAGAPARITVQWNPLGDAEWEQALRPVGTRTVGAAVAASLPERLAVTLVERTGIERSRSLSNLTRAERLRLIDALVRCELPWTGDEGYKKAEVTGGGVDLAEVNTGTMESRRHPGLFLCGEMLDAFGPIGGYNFLWAWATGRAAGLGAAAYVGRVYGERRAIEPETRHQ
jgi:predicted Rossmann fold flavoprotein